MLRLSLQFAVRSEHIYNILIHLGSKFLSLNCIKRQAVSFTVSVIVFMKYECDKKK